MEDRNLKFTLSQNKYDKLIETVTRANALTQVLLTLPTANRELIPPETFHDFLMMLNDLTYQAHEICHTLKPQPRMQIDQSNPILVR